MTSYFLGQLTIWLAITFLTSRLGLWLTRRWRAGRLRIIAVHAACLAIVMVIAIARRAHEGFYWTVGLSFVLPQVLWLAVDLLRHRIAGEALKRAATPPRPQ